MLRSSTLCSRLVSGIGVLGVVIGTAIVGCGREDAGAAKPEEAAGPSLTQADPSTGIAPAAWPGEPRLQQPFSQATRQEPPAEWIEHVQRPPDVTMAGKSVGKLYEEVVRTWDSIHYTSVNGSPIHYIATLDTTLGPIEIALRPDIAPNHVRNFIALARAGYYDGLVFERTVHARSEEQPEVEIDVLEGGCPLGTGDLGFGSIGYWLKPEFTKEPHDVGTVGACHGAEPDTACCRFYITLSKAPVLDGNFTVFGKVTQGLDVARRIFSLPVRNDPEYPEGDRPESAVTIRKVTISTAEAASENAHE
jgi:peptidyl-prolyl cis-trans isomerase B (cyclophilin B)